MHEVRDVPVERNVQNVVYFQTRHPTCQNMGFKCPQQSVFVYVLNTTSQLVCRVVLFDRQRVRPRDGQLVEEHQELAEGLEEGPAGEQADAFVGVHGPVGDHLLLHRGEHAQLDLLLLAQQID